MWIVLILALCLCLSERLFGYEFSSCFLSPAGDELVDYSILTSDRRKGGGGVSAHKQQHTCVVFGTLVGTVNQHGVAKDAKK